METKELSNLYRELELAMDEWHDIGRNGAPDRVVCTMSAEFSSIVDRVEAAFRAVIDARFPSLFRVFWSGGSFYAEATINDETIKIRVSDHANTSRSHEAPDANIVSPCSVIDIEVELDGVADKIEEITRG